jgi:thiol:disulfide interchange protein DsbC
MSFSNLKSVLASALLIMLAPIAVAAPADKAQEEKLRAALDVSSMGLKVESVSTSEVPGLFAVQFANGPLVYATAAGDHFIVGDMFAVEGDGFVNLGERRRDEQRLEELAAVPMEEMIVFSPKGEPRAYVNVFTDITCFYCQKLHKEVPKLNAQGVEVRYLAYPRAGLDSPGFSMLASAWCADDPRDTLTRLKNKEVIEPNVCAGNPIAKQFQLGQNVGVRGTPAIITQDGTMIPGYQSADELMGTLGLN